MRFSFLIQPYVNAIFSIDVDGQVKLNLK